MCVVSIGIHEIRIKIRPRAAEFSAKAKDLADKVASAVAAYGADKVCVLHISFEEAVAFFATACEYDVLSTVKWYGSDGACASDMVNDPVAKDFAIKVKYPCTMFAPAESAKREMVRQNGIEVLGREPETYSYVVYDIVWVYAQSLLKVDKYDSEAVRAVLPEAAASFLGASGRIASQSIAASFLSDHVLEANPVKPC